MDSPVLLQKILELERQILELKSQFPAEEKRYRIFQKIKAAFDGLLSYWVPLALVVGLFLNWLFGVGFLQDIKNIGINKKSSDYYFHIGDKLMNHAEFKAAGEAFAKSIEINPYNIEGTHGLMKAQVFQAVGDNEIFNPIVVENKLAYLRNIFGNQDYVLLYWEGILRRHQSADPLDLKLPESLFQLSIARNPSFLGSHLELGNTYLLAGEIGKAVKKFEDVLAIDPRFSGALNNLGYCQLVLATFETEQAERKKVLEKASIYLEKARKSGHRPETDLHLGDAYLFWGQFDPARISHQNAMRAIEQIDVARKDYNPFLLLFVYLPETSQEERDRGPAISVSTLSELKTLTFYSLSLDYAALGDFKTAEKHFADAEALDPGKQLNPLVANKIYVLHQLSRGDVKLRRWQIAKIETLCRGLKGCAPGRLNSNEKGQG